MKSSKNNPQEELSVLKGRLFFCSHVIRDRTRVDDLMCDPSLDRFVARAFFCGGGGGGGGGVGGGGGGGGGGVSVVIVVWCVVLCCGVV